MAENYATIYSGAGQLFIHDTTAALPTSINDGTGATVDWTGWTEIVFQDGGVEVESTRGFQDIKVVGRLGTYRRIPNEAGASFKVKTFDQSIENIRLAMNMGDVVTIDSTTGQAEIDTLTLTPKTFQEKQLCFYQPQNENGDFYRIIHVPVGVFTGGYSNTFNDEAPSFELEFMALERTKGLLFKIYNKVTNAD